MDIYADTHSAYDLLTLFSLPHTLADPREHFQPEIKYHTEKSGFN